MFIMIIFGWSIGIAGIGPSNNIISKGILVFPFHFIISNSQKITFKLKV